MRSFLSGRTPTRTCKLLQGHRLTLQRVLHKPVHFSEGPGTTGWMKYRFSIRAASQRPVWLWRVLPEPGIPVWFPHRFGLLPAADKARPPVVGPPGPSPRGSPAKHRKGTCVRLRCPLLCLFCHPVCFKVMGETFLSDSVHDTHELARECDRFWRGTVSPLG